MFKMLDKNDRFKYGFFDIKCHWYLWGYYHKITLFLDFRSISSLCPQSWPIPSLNGSISHYEAFDIKTTCWIVKHRVFVKDNVSYPLRYSADRQKRLSLMLVKDAKFCNMIFPSCTSNLIAYKLLKFSVQWFIFTLC